MREATPADNAELCALFADTALSACTRIVQERDPDFFALHRMHGGPYSVLTLRDAQDRLLGCASFIVRRAWLHGDCIQVGYLSDLRVQPELQGTGAFRRVHLHGLKHTRAAHGASLFYAVVFDDNLRAKAILTQPRDDLPAYRPMTPYNMVSWHLTGQRRRRRPVASLQIQRATRNDATELVTFLAARNRQRVLGEVFDASLLEHRLRHWPGFALDSFWLARTASGALVGCVAPWNTADVKRTRVLGYGGALRVMRYAYDMAARLRGFAPLPAPGECLRMAFLSHMEVTDDDPAVLRALIEACADAVAPKALHLLAAMVPRKSGLENAFHGLFTTRTPMTLYSAALADSPHAHLDLRTLRPGFEMALS